MAFHEFWSVVAHVSGAVAVFAQARAKTSEDPVQDLTMMVRQPIRWTLTHPLRATRRSLARRRARRLLS